METTILVVLIFLGTVFLMIWRPLGINEATFAVIGAFLVYQTGILNLSDIFSVLNIVSDASFTIIATLVMASLLENIGFFKHTAYLLLEKCGGSGKKLFFFILSFSFLMTLLFNNDGSILICTPIIIQIVRMLKLKFEKAFPFLIGSALVATASSAPIGASNIANLVAMKVVGLNLNSHTKAIFIPAMAGILVLCFLLFRLFYKNISFNYDQNILNSEQKNFLQYPSPTPHLNPPHPPPKVNFLHKKPLPHHKKLPANEYVDFEIIKIDPVIFRIGLILVVIVRLSFFAAAYFHIPMVWVSLIGVISVSFLTSRKQRSKILKSLLGAPWHIFLFAFGMYLIIFALKKAGLFELLALNLHAIIGNSLFRTTFISGLLSTSLAALLNNHPTVMLITSMLSTMGLPHIFLKTAYNATILGSDIGSLLTPIGTLASLIWFHLVNKNSDYKISWSDYMKVSLQVIPLSLVTSVLTLYLWTRIIY